MRSFGSRVVEAVVVLLALYAFVMVPLGQKTLCQHLVAIFTTPTAKHAADDVSSAVHKLWTRSAHRAPASHPAR